MDWIVQHLIGSIPVYAWVFVAGAGAGAYIISGLAGKFQAIKPYAILLRIISIVVFTVGIFLTGGQGVTAVWQERIKLKQQEIDIAQQKSKDAVKQQRVVYITKLKVIHDKQIVVKNDIQRDAVEIDATCKVSPKAISDLNEATK